MMATPTSTVLLGGARWRWSLGAAHAWTALAAPNCPQLCRGFSRVGQQQRRGPGLAPPPLFASAQLSLPTTTTTTTRPASRGMANAAPKKKAKDAAKEKQKKKMRTEFKQYDLQDADQFSLCDAMRYIRAFEVGQELRSPKYEMHIKLRTLRNGPSIRNRVRLPHPVRTDVRVCVICPPDSRHAADARRAGAVLVGEDEVFAAVLAKRIEFDRCLCHPDSLARLNKSGVARILGPRRLMPTPKTGTVVSDIGRTVAEMVSGSEYRERLGVVRMAVGHLGLTPEELQSNIRAFMAQVKKDASVLSEKIKKEIHEVVLSSTHAPGFTLNGDFRSADSVSPRDLSIN